MLLVRTWKCKDVWKMKRKSREKMKKHFWKIKYTVTWVFRKSYCAHSSLSLIKRIGTQSLSQILVILVLAYDIVELVTPPFHRCKLGTCAQHLDGHAQKNACLTDMHFAKLACVTILHTLECDRREIHPKTRMPQVESRAKHPIQKLLL